MCKPRICMVGTTNSKISCKIFWVSSWVDVRSAIFVIILFINQKQDGVKIAYGVNNYNLQKYEQQQQQLLIA